MTQRNNRIEEPFRKNVSFMFLTYWSALVIWQNVSGIQGKSSLDILVKAGLLLYFSVFYLYKAKKISVKIIFPFFMLLSLIVTSVQEDDFSVGILLNYYYPVVFTIMVYGIGNKLEISKKNLISFYKGIIAVTMYSAIYAIIFCTDNFVNALSITNAYSNELSSFFVSPHEYGMYMAAGAIACIVCLKLDRAALSINRMLYYVSLVVLLINMLLSFSRTATFSMVIFIIIYTFYEHRNKRKKLMFLIVMSVCIVLLSPTLRDFVFNIIMKGNHMGTRKEIYGGAINIVKEADLFNKVFGFGINKTNNILRTEYGVSSAHNAYLQILLNFGIVGFLFLMGFILSQIVASFKLMRINRYFGGLRLGLCIMASAMMFTNTAIVFTSPIDSFFLSMFMFVVPKYVRNAILNDRFE